MVSVFFADTVNSKAWQTSTMTFIISASPCGDPETIQASFAYSIPHSARRTLSIAASSPIDVDGSFRCPSSARMTVSSLNLWRTTVGTTAEKMMTIRTDAVIRSYTSSHPIVELSDDCYYLRWYSDASEYLPQEGAVNGVVRLLEINEAYEEIHSSCLPPNFL